MRKLLLIFILISGIYRAFPQIPEIRFDRISVQEGLTDHTINSIMQDRKGFIWMGSGSGLYRYDGYHFTFYKNIPGCNDCSAFGNVYKIEEDDLGLLWIMSNSGITLFDPESERSIILYTFPADSIHDKFGLNPDIFRDSKGNIWASSISGLLKINYRENIENNLTSDIIFRSGADKIYTTETISFSANDLTKSTVSTKIFEDNKGNIWVGCTTGLYLLRNGDKSFIRLDGSTGTGKSTTLRDIKGIVQKDENSYWVIAGDDLWVISNIEKVLLEGFTDTSLLHFSKNSIIGAQTPSSLIVDRSGNLLLGTQKDIYRILKNDKADEIYFELIKEDLSEPEDIGYNKRIQDIFEDRTGVIWVAQSYFGISKFSLAQTQFSSYKNLIMDNFKSADINPILKDVDNNLWVGTFGGGLYKIQNGNFEVTHYDLTTTQNKIICMKEASNGLFWIGLNPGILEFNPASGKFRDPLPKGKVANNLRGSYVYDMLSDGSYFFIGTLCGLFVSDITGKELYQYSLIKNDSINDYLNGIRSLVRLRNGDILAGTPSHGINRIGFNPENGTITLFPVLSNTFLADNGINLFQRYRLFEDSKGLLWVADVSGLHSININSLEVNYYKLLEDIDSPSAWSITEDNTGNLWIGTHYGLCRFNKETGEVKVFTKDDGVPITIHGFNSVFKDKDGRLYFGGIGGFYDFYPDNLKTNDSIPPVVITDLKIFNKSIYPSTSEKSILSRNIAYSDKIELPFNQNNLSFEFAALDYTLPSKNKYAYKLEGLEEDWIETDGANRTAYYTKLDPGNYVFRVKGSNNDGIWNETETSIAIIVHKPWWTTSIAWAIYIFVSISLLGGFIRWRLLRLGIEKANLERVVLDRTREIEVQKEKILAQKDMLESQNKIIIENENLKNRFFANVSHEFRTPLALIHSPVEELLNNPKRSDKELRKLNMVLQNVNRLLNLVDQLLDISKIENSKMKLELFEGDIIKYLRSVSGSFISLAEKKNIRYHTYFPSEEIIVWFDPDKLEKITTNLLFNAFKFTPDGGEIEFSAHFVNSNNTALPSTLQFEVKDTGIGISAKNLEKIFDRFFQAEESVKSERGGTGIGLSLVRDLVSLMHGSIEVQSVPSQGTVFSVSLPLGKTHLMEEEFKTIESLSTIIDSKPFRNQENDDYIQSRSTMVVGNEKPTILIVDDNRDLLTQLSDNLETRYNVHKATDGETAYRRALDIIPDLIITDLMMPKMNGNELCKKLKSHELTSHIPIVMLTAKSMLEDKIKGLQTGVDDYITKPFLMAEVEAKVANLIEQRKILRERFSREIFLEPRDISITPLDEIFLKKAIAIIESQINQEDFDLERFRNEMNMSRSTLFRKLFALTGQSPSDFIRTIRLKRAASLMKQNFGNITQISLEVGFNNLSYFNRSFKKLFGVSPSEYKKKNIKS